MAKTFSGILDGERFTATLANLTSTVSLDILSWGTPPAFPEPNASFTISLVEGPVDWFPPAGVFLRATNITGFSVSEPAGVDNQYDPTQHRITFIWSLPDEGYTPVVPPNIPTAWRNRTVAYGKQIAHVFTATGAKEVSCFAFDDEGNWGIATWTSPTIVTQDSVFPTNKTIVVSQESNWSGEPTGATRVTSLAAARTAMQARWSAGDRNLRVLVRSGETFVTDTFLGGLSGGGDPGDPRSNNKGLVIGIYGGTTRATVQASAAGTYFRWPDRNDTRQFVVSDLIFQGEWDSTTETGNSQGEVVSLVGVLAPVIVHRVKCSGLSTFISGSGGMGDDAMCIVSDCEATNWSNYGMAFPSFRPFAVIDSDIHQTADALCGINQGILGGQQTTELGNRHGPVRFEALADSYWARTSFLGRGGWSQNLVQDYVNVPPTNEQGLRFFAFFTGTPATFVTSNRHHHMMERCSIEGGQNPIGLGPSTFVGFPTNFVMDKVLIVASGLGVTSLVAASMPGLTIRNLYGYYHDIANQGTNTDVFSSMIGVGPDGRSVTGLGPVRVYNTTLINNAPSANMRASFTPISIDGSYDAGSGQANNVIVVPSRGLGASFAPLGTGNLPGFTCRSAGLRWNFPPVVATSVTARRESAPGVISAGTVANGEWINLPYPNWTGLCNGAGNVLGTLNATKIASNSTQKHVVSITSQAPFMKTDTSLFPGSKGGVTFDFHSSGIRIQNNTGSPWTSGQAWLLLDMSDYLMAEKPGTGRAGTALPLPAPLAGSSALSTGSAQPRTVDDFLGTRKPGSLTNTGTFVPGSASQGAFEPV
jgi:hypothetical protein